MKIDIFCMTCGTSYKADISITRCPECERRKNIMKEINEAFNKLDVSEYDRKMQNPCDTCKNVGDCEPCEKMKEGDSDNGDG